MFIAASVEKGKCSHCGAEGYYHVNRRSSPNPVKGGFVANTAFVGDSVWVGVKSTVCGFAQVSNGMINGNAIVRGNTIMSGGNVTGNAIIEGDTVLSAGTFLGWTHLTGGIYGDSKKIMNTPKPKGLVKKDEYKATVANFIKALKNNHFLSSHSKAEAEVTVKDIKGNSFLMQSNYFRGCSVRFPPSTFLEISTHPPNAVSSNYIVIIGGEKPFVNLNNKNILNVDKYNTLGFEFGSAIEAKTFHKIAEKYVNLTNELNK